MSGESAKSSNRRLESVPLAEHENLKRKCERLSGEHETLITKHKRLLGEHESLIRKLELLEEKYGFTVENVEKKQGEVMVAKKEIEKWEKKFGELEMKLGKVEKEIEEMGLPDGTEMDSGGIAENLNVNSSTESDMGVIEISDDDEGQERKSNGRHSNSQSSKLSFFM